MSNQRSDICCFSDKLSALRSKIKDLVGLKAANSEIKLGLPCMVPDLVYKFQMISFKEITTKTSYISMT
jgi:hypothetical protein